MADRRIERTRNTLLSAFIELLLVEGYDAVTVERVAERANVGRSTFYMHFKSKDEILKRSLLHPSSTLSVLVGNTLPPDVLVKQLLHFHEQRRKNHVFFEGSVRTAWVVCVAELIEPRLAAVVRHARSRPVLPLPLIARQIAEAQLALIANWLMLRPTTKVDAVADALVACTRAILASLIGAPANAPLTIPGERLRFVQS